MKRLTKRYIINEIDNLNLSKPIRYERYYLSDNKRIQMKNNIFEKEELKDNIVINKEEITEEEFNLLKVKSSTSIIRESYLYLKDNRVSIKKYLDKFAGLIRVEVSFRNSSEMNNYQKESWMGKEITNTALAFDSYLCKLSSKDFQNLIKKYNN